VDGNQAEIVAGLRAVGCTVAIISEPVDLLVGYVAKGKWGGPRNALMEVKTPGGKLNEGQSEFFETWRGQVSTVHSLSEALEVIGMGHLPWKDPTTGKANHPDVRRQK
jgi:hypothetical protein